MQNPNSYVTLGQLETTLQRSFDAFFVRIEVMVDRKIDEKMDAKLEQFAIMIQKNFTAIDQRFDRLEVRMDNVEAKLDIVCGEIGRHHIRLLRLERERDF